MRWKRERSQLWGHATSTEAYRDRLNWRQTKGASDKRWCFTPRWRKKIKWRRELNTECLLLTRETLFQKAKAWLQVLIWSEGCTPLPVARRPFGCIYFEKATRSWVSNSNSKSGKKLKLNITPMLTFIEKKSSSRLLDRTVNLFMDPKNLNIAQAKLNTFKSIPYFQGYKSHFFPEFGW